MSSPVRSGVGDVYYDVVCEKRKEERKDPRGKVENKTEKKEECRRVKSEQVLQTNVFSLEM